ncbi:MAG: tripartite tricarboxylate transporter substrate binding protein [Betaproteobacteria bacterium]|nr:tripartite tricarboxylate transporter substrate binding protein [Betaproteobacteria bacterium]NBY71300.1 tripartite tricarboxylate transporter substrate binding protein [Betaproteobacteria bacterium]NDD12524.1 tripartite tricarboxylate transporter substrate binding protein [Betaproteobacteria bacterium]
MKSIKFKKLIFGLSILFLGCSFVSAQTGSGAYPSKTIRLVVPFTAGSASDVLARTVADKLSQSWGQPVIIDNKPGAGGVIGTTLVSKSEPDGYTLLVVSAGHVVNPSVYPNLPYDTLKDFAGVIPLASMPSVLAISSQNSIKNTRDFVNALKSRPSNINYVSGGIGSASHVSGEKFLNTTALNAVHIPLKGAPDMVTELIAQRADFGFLPITAAISHVKSGRLKAIAVSSPYRSSALPEIPTLSEEGLPNAEFNFWIGLLAPSKTPKEIVLRLNNEISKIIQSKDVSEKYQALGAEPMLMSPNQFDAFMGEELNSLAKVIKTKP